MKKNFNKKSPHRSFNDNPVESILRKSEEAILTLLNDDEEAKEVYDVFNNDFKLYLSKLPSNPVKEYTSLIFNKDIIFIGLPLRSGDVGAFARVIIDGNSDKLGGVILNALYLKIDATTGETTDIDDCVYAAYYGFIRSSILIFPKEVIRHKKLHKLMTTVIFLMFLKLLGKSMIVSAKRKRFLHILCVYMYYKHFIPKSTHIGILNIIDKQYVGDIIPKEDYDEIRDRMDILKSYSTMKDMPRLINEFKIASINISQFLMQMLKNLQRQGFYSLMGSLDGLIASIIIAQYPNSLMTKFFLTNQQLHNNIEKIINTEFMNKIKFDSSYVYHN